MHINICSRFRMSHSPSCPGTLLAILVFFVFLADSTLQDLKPTLDHD